MKRQTTCGCLAGLALLAAAAAPAALSAGGTPDAALELRATQAFNKGDFAQALPMFQQLESDLKPDPGQADKVGMIQEQERVCQKNLATAKPAVVAAPTNADRKPHPALKAGETLDTTIKELGNFDYDPDQNTTIPADVKALSGHTVRLHGFMIPMDQAENISKFALVPSLFNCCYGQPPQVQHTIVVNCPKGKAVSYYPDEIVVEGKLNVDVMKDDGFVVGIFSIETTSVKPATK